MWMTLWRNQYYDDLMNLNMIDRHKSILCRFENVWKKFKVFWKKVSTQSTENWKCYNCEVIEHLVRNCKKFYCEKKELMTINKKVMHNQLSWTACYNDMCWTH